MGMRGLHTHYFISVCIHYRDYSDQQASMATGLSTGHPLPPFETKPESPRYQRTEFSQLQQRILKNILVKSSKTLWKKSVLW